MPLPSIKITLPVIAVAWGVGAWAAGMAPLLIYPAMWVGVALLLAGINLALGKPATAEASTAGAPSSES
ncbi:MAG: hypothetical protein AAGJ46_19885 [Planctomycetota bacterium]